MKSNKVLLLLCSALLITGCTRKPSIISSELITSSSSISSNEVVSSSEIESSSSVSESVSSSESLSSSVSSSEEIKSLSLKEIKEEARKLSSQVNDLGVAESNISVSIDLKLIAIFDMITTKSGMGDRYKLLMTDGNDYIYVKTDANSYSKAKSNIGNVLNIKGTISLYCGVEEITHDKNFNLVSNKNINDPEFKKITLEEAYQFTDNMSLNNKGCNGGKLASIECKLIGKMDDTNGLFYDGTNIINVHGDSKFLNKMTVGSSYVLKGALNVYNFRPGFQYYSHTSSSLSVPSIDESSLELINEDVYQIKYEVDKNPQYPNYSNMFKKLRRFEGYVNYYIKDYKYYTVLENTFKEDVYNAYTNAAQAKTLFLKNENTIKLNSDRDVINNPFAEHFDNGDKISVIVAPYLWNTNKYWQVFALEDSIKVINENA